MGRAVGPRREAYDVVWSGADKVSLTGDRESRAR